MERIETERLILRGFAEDDYDDLYEFLSQLRDDEFEGYPGITYENGREHLKYRMNSGEFYAVELRETGKVIGNIFCGNRDFEAKEIGYIIHAGYQRKGYALEGHLCIRLAGRRMGKHNAKNGAIVCSTRSWKISRCLGRYSPASGS